MKKLLAILIAFGALGVVLFGRELMAVIAPPTALNMPPAALAKPHVIDPAAKMVFLSDTDPRLYAIGPVNIEPSTEDGEIVLSFELRNKGTLAIPFPALQIQFLSQGKAVRRLVLSPSEYEHPALVQRTSKLRLVVASRENESAIQVLLQNDESSP